MNATLFKDLPLSEETLRAIDALGISEMTEIQRKAIPEMLEGRDVIGRAPTGTGKTYAFGVPIVERIDPESKDVQALSLIHISATPESFSGISCQTPSAPSSSTPC